MIKEVYFNITYDCNSQCLFCASDTPYTHRKSKMTLKQVRQCLKGIDLFEEDRITINGGEPTIHPEIAEIVLSCNETGARVILFTNGRKLADPQIAEQLVTAGISKVTIPIYSPFPPRHDYLTQVRRSFSETVKGIDNLISLKDVGYPFEIELKTLFCRYNLEELPHLLEWITQRFPELKKMLLSSMNLSYRALQHHDQLFVTFSDAQKAVNGFAEKAFDLGMDLYLCYIPLCFLDDNLREKVFQEKYLKESKTSHFYFDPDNLKGIYGFQSNTKAEGCVGCCLYSVCDGVWDTYGRMVGYNEMTPLWSIDKKETEKGGI
ncbi:MAG: radical SAM protein [Theionarchaea archaeon]|nr:radical SAM protein [Theionarchaea archaeon]